MAYMSFLFLMPLFFSSTSSPPLPFHSRPSVPPMKPPLASPHPLAPPPPHSSSASSSLVRPPQMSQERMNSILEALIGTGDFANWADLLAFADPALLPFTTTLFVPDNDEFVPAADGGFDPFLFLYHVVPHRLSFSDLCLLRADTRLPTLLPTKSILVTNSSRFNFTLDGVTITDPDIYSTDSVSVHGIHGLLNYQKYGGGGGTILSFPMKGTPPHVDAAAGARAPATSQISKGDMVHAGFAFMGTVPLLMI
uniref:FAS1 domain-containing protein n=1 Tax=Kalanchoe fedtschenkoi TaxID=63787 RepID=A0A7N0V3R2_KALFE